MELARFCLICLCAAAAVPGGAAEHAGKTLTGRRLADAFNLNIPGVIGVHVAAPPLPDKHKFAKAPGPFNVDVVVDMPPFPSKKEDVKAHDVSVTVSAPPHPEKEHVKDDKYLPEGSVNVNVAVPPLPDKEHYKKDKDILLAPSPGAKHDGSVDVSVKAAGRKLQTFTAEGTKTASALADGLQQLSTALGCKLHYLYLHLPWGTVTVENLGGQELPDERPQPHHPGSRKLKSTDVEYPGGSVKVGTGPGPAPAPSPAVDVHFPGGSVSVDPRTGVKVAFPGGGVNVGRKLQQPANSLLLASSVPLLLLGEGGKQAGPNQAQVAELLSQAFEALPRMVRVVCPMLQDPRVQAAVASSGASAGLHLHVADPAASWLAAEGAAARQLPVTGQQSA